MNPDIDQNKPLKIGLALSGGGIRAVAHLGVMQALTDHGIEFSHISASSAGAVAAVFFSEGYTPAETLKIINEAHFLRLLRPAFGSPGLVSILNAQTIINEFIPHNSFSKLKIPVTIAAVDIGEGKLVYFNDGELDKCILASCCLPGIFRPIVINDHMYIDGGVMNNFPAEPLVGNCDFIIGSSCNHLPMINEIKSFGELVDRAALLAVNVSLDARKALCDVVIEPHGLGGYGIFDTKDADVIFMIGYEEGLKALDGNEKLQSIIPAEKLRKKRA